jgi:hypothetical protein
MYRPVVPSVHHTSTGRAAASPIPWLDRRRKDHHQLRYLDETVGMSEKCIQEYYHILRPLKKGLGLRTKQLSAFVQYEPTLSWKGIARS